MESVCTAPFARKSHAYYSAAYAEAVLTSTFGTLPREHALTQYADGLLQRLLKPGEQGYDVIILDKFKDINACALPNKHVLVSRTMFDFCETEDELLYVLGHELNHIRKNHFVTLKAATDPFLMLSRLRWSEYESDIASAQEMEKNGLNPYGGMLFSKKLAARYADGGSDIAHGRDIDRLLNLIWVSKLVDQSSLSTVTTPIPYEIRAQGTCSQERVPLEIIVSTDLSDSGNRTIAANHANIYTALQGLRFVHPDSVRQYKEQKKQKQAPGSYGFEIQRDTERIVHTLDANVRKHLSSSGIQPDELDLFTGIVQTLCTNLDLAEDYRIKENGIGARFFEALKDRASAEKLVALLTPETFERCGLAPHRTQALRAIMHGLSTHLFETGIFTKKDSEAYADYARRFVSAVEGLTSDGLDAYIKENVFASFFQAGLYEFSPGERAAKGYIDAFAEHLSSIKLASVASKVDKKYNRLLRVERGTAEYGFQQLEDIFEEYAESQLKLKKPIDFFGRTNKEPPAKDITALDVSQVIETFRHAYANKHRELAEALQQFCTQHSGDVDIDPTLANMMKEIASGIAKTEHPQTGVLNVDELTETVALYRISVANMPIHYEEILGEILEDYNPVPVWNWKPESAISEFTRVCDALFQPIQGTYAGLRAYTPSINDPLLGGRLADFRYDVLEQFLDKDKEAFCDALRATFKPYSRHIVRSLVNEEMHVENLRYWKIPNAILHKYSFQLESKQDLHDLGLVSLLIPKPALTARIQSFIADRLFDMGTFEELYHYLFEENKQHVSSKPLEKLVEEKATTFPHLALVRDKLDYLLKKQADNKLLGPAMMGLEFIFEDQSTRDVTALLRSLMQTHETDKPLKRFLFNLNNHIDICQDALETLYSLEAPLKYAIIRNMLVSPNGILMREQSKDELVEYIFTDLVSQPATEADNQVQEFTKKVLEMLVSHAEVEQSYFSITPLLLDRILVRPKNPTSWQEIAWSQTIDETFSKRFTSEKERHLAVRHLMGEDIQGEAKEYFLQDVKNSEEAYGDEYDISAHNPFMTSAQSQSYLSAERAKKAKALMKEFIRTLKEIKADTPKISRFHDEETVKAASEGIKSIENIIGSEREDLHKMDTLEFVIAAAKNLGSPGVRFLQLLGQYVALPPSYAEKFSEVYDSIRGQSKLAAHFLLEREWPEAAKELTHIGKSIGGGSLMTVYEVKAASGSHEVLKVLNPNAEFFNGQSFKVLESVFESLAQDDPRYRLAEAILEDVKEWITKDIQFADFLPQDRRFFEQNNGFDIRNNPYRIRVPRSLGEENRYFKREEFIDGINLTHFDALRSERHDLRSIMGLLANNYRHQLVNGLVHSDVHPGNFRVTKDRQVAILDRNYFLSFDLADNMFLAQILQHAKDVPVLSKLVTDYLIRMPENGKLEREEFSKSLATFLYEKNGTLESTVDNLTQMVSFIKQQNAKLPLKTTLLIKNLFCMDKMCKRAGFERGIIEALA